MDSPSASEPAPAQESDNARAQFVHLHVHTQYSLLEGAIRVKPLIEKVKSFGMPALAITDSNNLFGAIDFYFACKDAGIKPIIGCEVLWAPEGRFAALQPQGRASGPQQTQFKPYFHHLVLLCKSQKGYQNLCEIVTRAYTEAPPAQKGQPNGPRALVDRELLDRYGEGLVVMTGCLRSELAYKILEGDEAGARESIEWFKNRFGGDFYLELVDSGIPEQELVNETLFEIGKQLGVRSVGSANCHYLNPEDAEAQEILQCIEYNKNLDIDRPKSLVPSEFYVKPAALMRERLERFAGAADATLEIAEKCNLTFKFKDEQGKPIYHLPSYRPDGVSKTDEFDLLSYFREEARKGLEARFEQPKFRKKRAKEGWTERRQSYFDRLTYELDMIERTGFAGYFLIVADYIAWAKKQGIPVGPGRGSGAGSVVAWSLGITDIDPIEFNLLFERFINPERVSMPDFDVDFCQDRRGEVIEYVNRKYGAQNVSQIVTFGKLQARAVIKDVGRVLGMSFAETDLITKLLPEELNIKLKDAIEKEPRIREIMQQDRKIGKLMEYALALEGLYRNAGVHAAGVIITEEPIVTYCPLYSAADSALVTQFDKDFSEKIGLVKYDFLGLKTLTVIDNAAKLIRAAAEGVGHDPENPEAEFSIDRINMEDSKVFDLISSGDTDGVFQIESSGMKDLCTRLKPNSLEDITAINALYRPGPLGSGMVDDFIDRKHGRKPIEYDVPQLESILKDTYGVILYQEQVMQIARELAGYSLGQADMLRRAMGKKKADEMAKHREIFVKGATEKAIAEQTAGGIFDLMAKFAEYGFNKSHSAAYGFLTYQTAFLKCYYPAEFMAALMTTEINNTDKITKYIGDARAHAMTILPPDVNASKKSFSVEKMAGGVRAIRFGLEAIKGVGGAAVDAILEARDGIRPPGSPEPDASAAPVVPGPFKSAVDFCKRVSTRKANKKVLEALTLAGAFDRISEVNRASLFESLEGLIKHAADEQEERALGQNSLFDSFNAEEIRLAAPTDAIFKQVEEWSLSQRLIKEKATVGFYVSGHPMDAWQKICEDWLGWSTAKLKSWAEKQNERQQAAGGSGAPQGGGGPGGYQRPKRKEARIAGLISELKEITTKKGSRMAFGQLEDLNGKIEVVFFPDAYTQCAEMLKRAIAEAEPVIVTGEMDVREGEPKILGNSMVWIEDFQKGRARRVVLRLNPSRVQVEQLRELKPLFLENRGKCPVRIEFCDSGYRTALTLPEDFLVNGSPQLVAAVNRVFGDQVVDLR